MPLRNKREQLEKKEVQYERPPESQTDFDVDFESANLVDDATEKIYASSSSWGRVKDRLGVQRMKAILVGSGVLFLIVLVALILVVIMFFGSGYFDESRVSIGINLPEEVRSGNSTEIIVNYTNNNRASLDDAVLIFEHGQYFTLEDESDVQRVDSQTLQIPLGSISGKGDGSVRVVGIYTGPRDEIENVSARLNYRVTSRKGKFSLGAAKVTKIVQSALNVDILAGQEIVQGDLVDLRIIYRNTSASNISDVVVDLGYPEGFSLVDASPGTYQQVDEVLQWNIGSVPANTQDELRVRGSIDAAVNAIQGFTANIRVENSSGSNVFSDDEHVYRVVQTPLEISQRIVGNEDGVVVAGDNLEYEITFTNVGDIPLRSITMEAHIEAGELLENTTGDVSSNGYYNPNTQTVQWKAVGVSQLETLNPGEGGKLNYSIDVKDRIPFTSAEDQNMLITSRVQAQSLDFPDDIRDNKNAVSNTLTAKLETKPLFELVASHRSGPKVLTVGEATKAGVSLRAGSVNNAMKNVLVEGFLAQGVSLLEPPSGGNFSFDVNSNRFTWDIGNIAAGVGVVNDLLMQDLLLEITPKDKSDASNKKLMHSIYFIGEDEFTGREVTLRKSDVTYSSVVSQ